MANASKKHIGRGSQGKGSGAGARTNLQADLLPENAVLSNRDKAEHPKTRGEDGKAVQTTQEQDHANNRRPEKEQPSRD